MRRRIGRSYWRHSIPCSINETTRLPNDFGRPTTFNTAPISSRDETGSLASSRPRRRHSSMSPGYSCRRRLCHRSWSVLQHRTAGELDRRGHRSIGGWDSRRTLGCHSGRSYRAAVQERESDVRRLIPEVNASRASLNVPLKHAIEAGGGLER
jgi:hypothetical protein